MALSDEQIVLKALEVAERRGWNFIMETMVNSSSTKRTRGLWGQQSDSNNVMASQESEEDEDDGGQDTATSEQRMQKPSWRQLVTHQKESFSFSKVIPMLSKIEDIQVRIKLFIDKTTRTFNDCFFSDQVDSDLAETDLTSSTAEPGVDVQTQTPLWDKKRPARAAQIAEGSCVNAQTQTPVWDKRTIIGGKHPTPVAKRPSSTRTTAVSGVHAQTQTPPEHSVPTQVSDPPQVAKPKGGTLERETVPWLKPAVFRSTFPLMAVARHMHPSEDLPWSLSLTAHVSKKLKHAVVSLRFFDMFLLLPDGNTDIMLPDQRTFERWQSAFAIMGSILLDNAPEKMAGFFNYCETIRKAHEHLPEGAWLEYDMQFRQLKELEPYINWAIIHPQLWPHIVKPAAPLSEDGARDPMYDKDICNSFQLGICANCGGEHLEELCPELDPDAVEQERPVPMGMPRKETDYCFEYNTDRCDKGMLCNFNHLCSNCDGDHPEFACPRLVPNIEEELGLAEPDFEPHISPPKKVKTGYCFLYNENQCLKGSDCFLCHVCANCGGEHPKLRCPILYPDSEYTNMAFSEPLKRSPKKVKTGYCFLYNEDQCSKGKDCFLSHICADCGGEHPKVRCPQLNPDYAEYELEPRMWSMKKGSHRDDPSVIKRPRLISGREMDEMSYMEPNVGFAEQAHCLDDPPILNWAHLKPDREMRKPSFLEPRVYSTRAGNGIDQDLNWRKWNPDREVHQRPYLEPNVGFTEQASSRDELPIDMWRKRNPERDMHKLPYLEPNVGFPEHANRRDDPLVVNWPHINPDRGMNQPPFTDPRVLSTYPSNRRDEPQMEKWPQLNADKETDNMELLETQGNSMKKAKTGYCFRYNKNECSDGDNCTFNHVCSKCSGEHPKVICPQLSEAREVGLQGSGWEEVKESPQLQYDAGMRDTGNHFSNVCLLCGESHPNEKCPRWRSESKKHPDYAKAAQDRGKPVEGQHPLYTAFE